MPELSLSPLPVYGPSATDQVFRALYEAVVTLKLPPGSKVSEAEVAKQLDVSRQPVRDAFFRLSNIGLLSIRPQRATLITHISETAVMNAVFMRVALEVECLRKAIPQMTDDDMAMLHSLLERQKGTLDSPDPAEFHALDEAMHLHLFQIAGHPEAWEVILEQKAHMDRIRRLSLSEERRKHVYAEHVALVDAIKARDINMAEKHMRHHLEDIKTVLAGLRARHQHYFE